MIIIPQSLAGLFSCGAWVIIQAERWHLENWRRGRCFGCRLCILCLFSIAITRRICLIYRLHILGLHVFSARSCGFFGDRFRLGSRGRRGFGIERPGTRGITVEDETCRRNECSHSNPAHGGLFKFRIVERRDGRRRIENQAERGRRNMTTENNPRGSCSITRFS